MLSGIVALTIGYSSLVYALQDSNLLTPAAEHCEQYSENDACSRADLFAFQIIPGLAMLWVAIVGISTWHLTKRVHTCLPRTPEGRLFGYLRESEELAAASLTFQVWDFLTSLTIEEHRTGM